VFENKTTETYPLMSKMPFKMAKRIAKRIFLYAIYSGAEKI